VAPPEIPGPGAVPRRAGAAEVVALRPSRATTATGSLEDADDADLVATWADDQAPSQQRNRAFHLLVSRYQRRLFSVCQRMLSSSEDAEEAVQETFVRLARHAHGFRGDAQVSTWLYSIARNVCTDKIRYSARRPATPVDDIASVTGDLPGGDEFAMSDTVGVLHRALAQLDERSRSLLLLVAVDELTYEEAAEVTGLAVGTVKSRVSRARVRLGVLLAGDEHDALPADAPVRSHNGPDRYPAAKPRGPPA